MKHYSNLQINTKTKDLILVEYKTKVRGKVVLDTCFAPTFSSCLNQTQNEPLSVPVLDPV